MKTRLTKSADIAAIQKIVSANNMFPPEMVPDMLSGFLKDSESSNDLWLTCEDNGQVAGFCYAVPEQLTEGTWNMLAIAVDPHRHRSGVGLALTAMLEDILREREQRILIVDTSGSDDFVQARNFYRKHGYTEEARIRDFWAAGDDKITYWKAL